MKENNHFVCCHKALCLEALVLSNNVWYTEHCDGHIISQPSQSVFIVAISIHSHMCTYLTMFTTLSPSLPSLGLHLVSAPWEQYVVEGEDITLQCSFSNPDNVYGRVITTIRRGGQTTPVITGATIGDEGEYRCEISLIDHSDSTQVSITLHVFSKSNHTPLTHH